MKYYLKEDYEYKEVDTARLETALEEVCEKSWNEVWLSLIHI